MRVLILVGAAATVTWFGQACSKAASVGNGGGIGLRGGFTEQMVGGNGGGYGGGPPEYYYSTGSDSTCSSYPAPWETVGPYITGIIDAYGNYRNSACDSPVPTVGPITGAGFDPDTEVYQDRIFWGSNEYPPLLSYLIFPKFYCMSVTQDHGVDVGYTVLVYVKNGDYFVGISEGRNEGGTFNRYVVDPFMAAFDQNSSGVEVAADGFKLTVGRTGIMSTTGSLSVVLDQSQINLSMKCWVDQSVGF
jgi:hypothetical protein